MFLTGGHRAAASQRKLNKTSEERKAAKVTSACSLLKDSHKNADTVFVHSEPLAPVLSG